MIKKRRNEKAAGRRRQKYTQMSTMEKGERKKERKKDKKKEKASVGLYISLLIRHKHVMGKPTSTYWDSLTGFLQNVIFQEMFNGSFPQRPRFDRWGVYRTFKIN